MLTAPPEGWQTTRAALHELAEHVMGPARYAVDQRIRLRWLPGGFGTPRFGADDRQIRVDGADLVYERGGDTRRAPITSCADAAALVGLDAEVSGHALDVDPAASAWLSDFYAFVLAVLEDLREEVDAEEPVIWPEHFDYAITAGDEDAGTRANYGGSPGDEHHDEPYLYVGPWKEQEGELWNATGFPGAELGLTELLAAEDQRAHALDFFRTRMRAL